MVVEVLSQSFGVNINLLFTSVGATLHIVKYYKTSIVVRINGYHGMARLARAKYYLKSQIVVLKTLND